MSVWDKVTQPERALLVPLMNIQQTRKEVIQLERTRRADKTFLEAILRIVSSCVDTQQIQVEARPFIALGMLFKGMGGWEMLSIEWDELGTCHDLDSVDAVLQEMITVLNLDFEALAMEASWTLKQVQRFFSWDLDSIKTGLHVSQVTEKYLKSLERWHTLQDDDASSVLYHHLEVVPVTFHWEKVAQSDLAPTILAQALQHSADAIRQTAALLIKHGAGGEEAIALAKQLAGEEEWKKFVES